MPLEDQLARLTGWRKKELAQIALFARSDDHEPGNPLLRASFSIVYAHWEGMAKDCASGYVDQVKRLGLPYAALKPCFLALSLKPKGRAIGSADRIAPYIDLVEELVRCGPTFVQRRAAKEIRTEANLSSETLDDVFCCIGIDKARRWDLRRNFIDAELVQVRNKVAHGGREAIDVEQLLEAAEKVEEMTDWFVEDLLRAWEGRDFLRDPSAQLSQAG